MWLWSSSLLCTFILSATRVCVRGIVDLAKALFWKLGSSPYVLFSSTNTLIYFVFSIVILLFYLLFPFQKQRYEEASKGAFIFKIQQEELKRRPLPWGNLSWYFSITFNRVIKCNTI